MIYSGFAGVGKTYASETHSNVIDLESSQFQWVNARPKSIEKNKSRYSAKNPEWPGNYISAIVEQAQSGKHVLISAQPEVLEALAKQNIPFITVTPDVGDKEAYIQRYTDRGNPQKFIDMMTEHFEEYIDDMDKNFDATAHIKLHRYAFISSIFDDIEIKTANQK